MSLLWVRRTAASICSDCGVNQVREFRGSKVGYFDKRCITCHRKLSAVMAAERRSGHGRAALKLKSRFCSHRICTTCSVEKEISEFWWDGRQRYRATCGTCFSGHRRRSSAVRRLELKQWAMSLFGNSCSDCGLKNLCQAAYDFHHLDPSQKDHKLNLRVASKTHLAAELAKCIMLCANCHRTRHFKGTD